MNKKQLRLKIREYLMENYPEGAANHPNAPWNQEEAPEKKISNSLNYVAGDQSIDFLVKSTGIFYVISRENLENNPQLENEIINDYGIEDEPLTTNEIMNAAEDFIEARNIGTHEDYRVGNHFVYRLTPLMAEELWNQNSELEQAPQVNRMIDYSKLRNQYPTAFKR